MSARRRARPSRPASRARPRSGSISSASRIIQAFERPEVRQAVGAGAFRGRRWPGPGSDDGGGRCARGCARRVDAGRDPARRSSLAKNLRVFWPKTMPGEGRILAHHAHSGVTSDQHQEPRLTLGEAPFRNSANCLVDVHRNTCLSDSWIERAPAFAAGTGVNASRTEPRRLPPPPTPRAPTTRMALALWRLNPRDALDAACPPRDLIGSRPRYRAYADGRRGPRIQSEHRGTARGRPCPAARDRPPSGGSRQVLNTGGRRWRSGPRLCSPETPGILALQLGVEDDAADDRPRLRGGVRPPARRRGRPARRASAGAVAASRDGTSAATRGRRVCRAGGARVNR